MFSEKKGEKRLERERERISLAFRPAGGSPPVGGNPWVVGFGATPTPPTAGVGGDFYLVAKKFSLCPPVNSCVHLDFVFALASVTGIT